MESVTSKDDFLDWKKHPITEVLMAELRQNITDMLDDWIIGVAIDNKIINAQRVGYAQAFQTILNWMPKELTNEA